MERFSYIVFILLCLLCFVFPTRSNTNCSSGVLQFLDSTTAKVKLSVLMSLRKPQSGATCGPLVESQLQVLAAVHWAVERINGKGFFPFTLGYELYDDCGNDWFSIQGLQTLYGCHLSTAKNECSSLSQPARPDIGLIGLTRMMTQPHIQDLSFRASIPVVSPFTTGKSTSSNIRTTRPRDIEQAKVIVKVMKDLNWTYAVAVHSDDSHSNDGIKYIKDLAGKESICVDILGSLSPTARHNDSDEVTEVVDKVWTARTESKTHTLGVVYFGNGYKGSLFSMALQEKVLTLTSGISHPVQLLLSEDLSEWMDKITSSSAVPMNILSLKSSKMIVQEFENDYNQQWIPKSNETSSNNPVEELMQQFAKETGDLPLMITSRNRNPLVPVAIDAVFVLAAAYKAKCNGFPTSCAPLHKMSRSELISYVKYVDQSYMDLASDVSPLEFKQADKRVGENLGFDVILIDKSTENFRREQVADASGDDYASNITNKKLPSSVCEGTCLGCVSSSPYPYAYVDGDVLLLGVFSVHASKFGQPFQCGELKTHSVQRILTEAFLYGIQKISERTGIKFGAIVFDVCESPSRASLIMSDFMAGEIRVNKPGTTEEIDPKKVRLVLGAYHSGTTIPLAVFFTNLAIPLVSYTASSPDLDDRLNYPYFLRTVPSDVEQAKAMIGIIKAMKWEYVSLMYVDNNYGKKGKHAFMQMAETEGICVTQPTIPLSQVKRENEDNDVLTLLRYQKPEVVVLFGIESRIAQLLKTQQEQFERISQSDHVIYLASEDWGASQYVLDEGKSRTLGSITLKLGSSNSADTGSFANYIERRTPGGLKTYNPFFHEMWANEFSCSPDASFDSTFDNRCSDKLRLPSALSTDFEENQRVVHLLNALYAIGDGIKQERDKLCNGEGTFICQNFITHPEIVTKAIQDARFFDSGREFAVFGEDGNGVTGFDILNVQKDTDGSPFYVKIGSFTKGELILDKDKLTFYDGDVKAQCGSDYCLDCTRQTSANGGDGGPCTVTDDLQVRSVDLAVIVILVVVCALLVAKTVYDTIRLRSLSSRSHTYRASEMSLSERNVSGETMLTRLGYDKPPAPKTFLRARPGDTERYQSGTPSADASTSRVESENYLHPDRMPKVDSHIYSTANLVD